MARRVDQGLVGRRNNRHTGGCHPIVELGAE